MERPPDSLLHALGALLRTKSPSQRLKHTEKLLSILPSTTPSQAPLIASLTTQTISQLFTNDEIDSSTEVWSRHPFYTEPLLESILNLLCVCYFQPPPTHPPPSQTRAFAKLPNAGFQSLYPPPYPRLNALTTAFQDASKSLTLSVAHLLSLLTVLATEQSTNIARLAYHTLASLARLLPAETRAAFLPGLISSLSKSLSRAADHHSTLCIAALDALHVVVSTLYLPPSKPSSSANDRIEPVPSIGKAPRPQLFVTRDSKWIETASKQAALRIAHILAAPTGPLHHSSPRARQCLALFISSHLHSTVLSDPPCRALLRMTLFALAGDEFPNVRTAALYNLPSLLKEGGIKIQEILHGIRAVVSAVGFSTTQWQQGERFKQLVRYDEEAMARLSDNSDFVWTRTATGFVNAFVTPQDAEDAPSALRNRLASSVTIIGPDAFCHMLVELLSRQWAVPEDSSEGFAKALDCVVLRAAFSIGREGLLTSLFSTLVKMAEIHGQDTHGSEEGEENHLQKFRDRSNAVLVLQAVLIGEIGREDSRKSRIRQRLVYECTKEALQLMNGFFLPTADTLRSGRIDDGMISLKHCLLICTARLFENLAALHREANIRPLGADITLVVLMSLLRDVSDGETSVRKTAHETMKRISLAIGWKNERRLLLRHLNYIISRVIRNLEQKWAGNILSFVVGNEADDVSREATILLESTLQQMNESLAGANNERALTTMNSIANVLTTAVAQNHVHEQDATTVKSRTVVGQAAEEIVYQNNLSDLRRSVFFYCKEDIQNYDKLIAKAELTDRSYLEDEEGDDGSNRNAFEAIAAHVLEGTRDIIVGRPWHVCAASLFCAMLSVKLLDGRRRILLPFAAKILPLIPDQFRVLNEELTCGEMMLRDFRRKKFGDVESGNSVEDLVRFLNNKGKELPVVTNACLLLAAFAAYAGSFIRDRFARLIYPKLRPLLRLAQYFPTLLQSNVVSKSTSRPAVPSYGAMSACDACLEALASVALVTPDVLAPFAASLVEYLAVFFDPKFDPAISPRRQVVHTNRSMVRFESERWTKRCEFAETIFRQLKIVNANEVLMALLKRDSTGPRNIEPVNVALHDITIPRSASM